MAYDTSLLSRWPPAWEEPERPAHEFLRKVVAVCKKRPHLVAAAKPGKSPRRNEAWRSLMKLIHPKPKKSKHGSRRQKRWEKNAPRYAEALDWWLRQDAITQLGGLT